jgi:cellulose synthase/poly-beta-1,6-N-acetylglucosamine synthase-like glycosyltransferase/peptidoglycan/xylan/chitin deacetylase (PgdA/CDA1 family)
MQDRSPVFYDPQNRRWLRFKRIVQLLTLGLGLIFSSLITSILINPRLPNLDLPPLQRKLEMHQSWIANKIALTFDDGPDKLYTPQILEILRRYHVVASFFVMGKNAYAHPELLQQIVQEGHEIGNHTWMHPNINQISQNQLAIELNATQRLLESQLGFYSILFRPPYEEYLGSVKPKELELIEFASKLGYYTVSVQIDSNDCHNPGVDKIINTTIQQAVSGKGNIVLLHDSGGDRSQTVNALPQIVEALQAHGFELVSISNLLSLSRNAVMPPIPKDERILASVNGLAFLLVKCFSSFVYYLLIVVSGITIIRQLLINILALYEWLRSKSLPCSSDYLPSVSVVVPAFNEETVILKTIHSLLYSNYLNFNIIVVDDGSSDRTYYYLVKAFRNHPIVRILSKSNGGKAQALNYGINQSQAEIVITIDADTILFPDTISKLVRHFAAPHVGAVAGNIKVGNRINQLTYWQALEYITTQNLERRVFGLLNCIPVVSGAIGAWRRQLILKAGGLTNDTVAEDADLTLAILRMGYKINYEMDAIAITEAPDTITNFLKQRFRWIYGALQLLWKHRDTLFRLRYGALGFFVIPNLIFLQGCFVLASPIADIGLCLSLALEIIKKILQVNIYLVDTFSYTIYYFILSIFLDFFASFMAFILEPKEDFKLIIWLPIQRFIFRQLIAWVAIKSIFTAIHGKLVSWEKIERKATVHVEKGF